MASKITKKSESLNLTPGESESLGVVFHVEPTPASVEARERLFHEPFQGALTEDDVTEALAGEVTAESREDVEDLFADAQEQEADRQAD